MSPPDGPTTASIATATLTPAGAHLVWIQATSTPGSLPRLVLTGIPEAGLPETRDRIRAAVLNAGLRWPTSAITLTVAPQPLVEADCGLDLAFALAILTATGQLPPQALDHQIGALGELGLDGSLRPVHAGDQRRQALAHAGIRRLIIPEATDLPAAGRPVLWAASGLAQVVEQLRIGDVGCLPDPGSLPTPDLERMVVLAAAGGHHLLLTGCPAPVANLASLVVAELLPDLDATTAAEVGDLWWQAGQPRGRPRTPRPPWATTTGPLPAGTHRRPGPVSLAHHGVFFHPDLTRLGPTQLHLLQTVLDTRHVDPHPSSGHRPWPARAQLVLTHPDPTPARLGGLPDRLELHLPTPVAGPAPLGQGPPGHPDRGTRLAAQVAQARQRATTRWACPQPMPNAEVEPTRLHRSIDLLPAPYLRRRAEAMRLTRRGWLRVLRLAWTIADLAAHPRPDQTDVDEAIAWATATIGQP